MDDFIYYMLNHVYWMDWTELKYIYWMDWTELKYIYWMDVLTR